MPLGAQIAFYAGVFFCFAPIGLLQGVMRMRVVPAWEIATLILFSGGIAVVYSAVATRNVRWMPVPIAVHVALTLLFAKIMPEHPQAVTLDADAVVLLGRQLMVIALLTIVSLTGAFVCFLMLIQREGLRFVNAHAEIRLARDIHATLAPAISGRAHGLRWVGRSQPSGEVGGDLVDVCPTTRPTWTAIVADVSGHGVAAGVLMGMCKTAFRACAAEMQDAGQLATRLNAILAAVRQPHMFITAACLHVDAASGQLDYVLCGHPPLLHLSAHGDARWVGDSQMALCLMDDTPYTAGTLDLSPGDAVVVITDGLLEVFDEAERELGMEGLRDAIVALGPGASPTAIQETVFDACRRHGIQTDDQTVLILEREGSAA
jgi:serine phosphatase RsbU (regulator of sigma subunit)